MTSEEARTKIAAWSIDLSDDSFFKYLKAGDREVVALFLDAGFSPDLCNSERTAAVLVATQAGQKDLARLLLARGASPEPLLTRQASKKDGWDKLTASSAVLSFISGVLIAAVGGYFTYSYNQRQIDLNRTQADHDVVTKEQANRVLELEAVQKLIPILTSKNEQAKAAALISIQDLAHPDLAAHFAVLFKGQGSVQYLQQAASSGTPNAKRTAVEALSTIAASGTEADVKLATRALSIVFQTTRNSVVRIEGSKPDGVSSTTGVFVTTSGFILTSTDDFQDDSIKVGPDSHNFPFEVALWVATSDGRKFRGRLISIDLQLNLAVIKVDGPGFVPVHLSPDVVTQGSNVIGIVYMPGPGIQGEASVVGSVAAIDARHIFFQGIIQPGGTGGPLLSNTGDMVGLMDGQGGDNLVTAIRSDVALAYLKSRNIL